MYKLVYLLALLYFKSVDLTPVPSTATLKVYVFLNTECPISQQYTQKLNELYRQFASKGVEFMAFYPLKTDTKAAIKQFQRDYTLLIPGQPDPEQQKAHYLHAQITPEVVVQNPAGITIYQGAIDNWYFNLGKHRPTATQHYLRDALEATLAGKPVPVTKTEAVGCLID